MRRFLASALALLLSGGVLAAGSAAHAAPGDLKTDLDAILQDSRLTGATADLIVRDASTGEILYDHDSNAEVTPASNNKIQTSTAAFAILGPGYRFRTSVYAKGGNLYLKGTGDPTMMAADYDRLAAAVAARGVKTVRGDLIADDTWFDDQRYGDDWDPTDFPFAYAAQISALTISPDVEFDEGTIDIGITPGARQGDPVHVALTPQTNVVKIDDRATTGAAGSANTLSIDKENGSNTITITGSYPVDGAGTDDLSTVENPTLYAADVFRTALQAHGVKISGGTEQGSTPGGASTVTARESMPLSQLATPFLKLSNNMIAEILVKAIGRKTTGQGSWAAGLPQVVNYLKSQGVDTSKVTMTDGSGLAHSNFTTALQISNSLLAVQRKPWFGTWYNALPIAGEPGEMVGGTLESRMTGTAAAGNVHAKTGSLTGVTALSGYVTDPTGRKLIFSSIMNGYKGSSPKDLEDRIAVRLASGTSAAASAATSGSRTAGNSGNSGNLECSWTRTC